MSKCIYCHERKGKRSCPALRGLICSQCCGEHRVVQIACPTDCTYLDSNTQYQQKRAAERFAVERRDFYKTLFELGGEPAAAVFNVIEMMTYSFFQHRHDGVDSDVLMGIESVRRSLSPLHIPAAPPPPFAERLKTELEAFSKQAAQQRQAGETANTQLMIDVLDRAVGFIKDMSEGLRSRRFLTAVIGYINSYHPEIAEHLTKHGDRSGQIVLPGDVPTGTIVSPEQFRAEQRQHLHRHT